MPRNESEYYIAAMEKDISQLVKHKTWERVNHNDIPSGPYGKPRYVFKDTSELKLKSLPDGSPLKYIALCCVRRYLQIAGVEQFKTYTPVVQWSTVCLSLTNIFSNH